MDRRIRIETDKAPPSTGFRSQAMVAAGFLFTGGQIGAPLLPEGVVRAPAASLEEQVDLCLRHLEQVTAAAGGRLDQVVEVSAFLVPYHRRQQVQAQVEAFFGHAPPLFNAQPVADVAMHGLLELDWIALVDDGIERSRAVEILAPLGHGAGLTESGPFVILNGITADGASLGEQSVKVLEKADSLLSTAQSTLRDVVKMTVYIREFDAYPQFNDATRRMFADFAPPTRSVLVAPKVTDPGQIRIDFLALR